MRKTLARRETGERAQIALSIMLVVPPLYLELHVTTPCPFHNAMWGVG